MKHSPYNAGLQKQMQQARLVAAWLTAWMGRAVGWPLAGRIAHLCTDNISMMKSMRSEICPCVSHAEAMPIPIC